MRSWNETAIENADDFGGWRVSFFTTLMENFINFPEKCNVPVEFFT